ncbi:MAG: GNAT family N-acetyltransferase [Archangium sp.]|nr:GNAT family N-acetyltransferase [Archangium sp.]
MIEVRVHHELSELDPAAMEKVNASSNSASLFSSPTWLKYFLAHDPSFKERGATPWLLAAWEGGVLKGYLALKRVLERGGPVLSSLISLEVERPGVVAAPEDLARVSQAFFRVLLGRASEWDLLEFFQQDAGSPLFHGPAELTGRHWLRRLPDRNSNVLALPFSDLAAYAASLSKNMRHSTKKQLKGLLASPGLTLLTAKNPAGCSALFEVFLDIERRSWKVRVGATVGEREALYRAAFADPSVETVACIASLDGLPMAGSIWVHYGRNTYHLQTIYSEAHEGLAPGTLMMVVTLADALERKSEAFDMLPDFSHYKARWGTRTIETQWVQIFRVGSQRHLRAVAGDFWRRVKPKPADDATRGKNPYKVAAGTSSVEVPADRPRLAALLAQARAAGAIEQDAAALSARNPFS